MSSFGMLTLDEFLAQTAAKRPTPGGGAVAGATGAMACALAHMVVSYSLGKKALAAHQRALEDASRRLERARAMMLELADEDAAAFGLVNELSRLPEGAERRVHDLPAAVDASVQVPLAVAATATDVLRVMEGLVGATNPQLRSDLAIAALLAEAAARASRWNVAINAPSLADEPRRQHALEESARLAETAMALARSVEDRCR
jgi:formiminotetrahydrofolate cyclodeaminase